MCLRSVFLLTMRLSRREETRKTAEILILHQPDGHRPVDLAPQNAPHGAHIHRFDSNYVFDVGRAKRARTADLLHAMKARHFH